MKTDKERMRHALQTIIRWLDYPGGGKEPQGAGAGTVEACLRKARDAIRDRPVAPNGGD